MDLLVKGVASERALVVEQSEERLVRRIEHAALLKNNTTCLGGV